MVTAQNGGRGPFNGGRLRSQVTAEELAVGTFIGTASPVTAEVCAVARVPTVGRDSGSAAARHTEGWTFLAIGSDSTLLAAAATEHLAAVRVE